MTRRTLSEDGAIPTQAATHAAAPAHAAADNASTGELITQLSDQSRRLIRDEIALAKLEMGEKAKSIGLGAGLFSAAGLLAAFGLGTLITTAILALARAVDAWLAALIVTIALFALAAVAALLGRSRVGAGTPPVPEKAITNVQRDVAEVKGARHREH
jgi:Putative Actinobacterial Holin-X, holin superfamily III